MHIFDNKGNCIYICLQLLLRPWERSVVKYECDERLFACPWAYLELHGSLVVQKKTAQTFYTIVKSAPFFLDSPVVPEICSRTDRQTRSLCAYYLYGGGRGSSNDVEVCDISLAHFRLYSWRYLWACTRGIDRYRCSDWRDWRHCIVVRGCHKPIPRRRRAP